MFEMLLKAGANVNVVCHDGKSALQLAIVSCIRQLGIVSEEFCDACWTSGEISPSRPLQHEEANILFRFDLKGQWVLSAFLWSLNWPCICVGRRLTFM